MTGTYVAKEDAGGVIFQAIGDDYPAPQSRATTAPRRVTIQARFELTPAAFGQPQAAGN